MKKIKDLLTLTALAYTVIVCAVGAIGMADEIINYLKDRNIHK